jgi:hypothetical protein
MIARNRRIEIQVCSDTDYDRLIAEVYIDGVFVCLLSQEDGPDRLMIEFPRSAASNLDLAAIYSLSDFTEGVMRAKHELTKGVH